jgi:hypothetical protein
MIERKGWAASKPVNKRMVVALLPASRTFSASRKPPFPTPCTAMVRGSEATCLIFTPKACRQATVEAQSAPGEKLLSLAFP